MMSRRSINLVSVMAAGLTSLMITACDGGYTVHPIITQRSDSLAVANLDGIWIMNDADDYWAMRISGAVVASRPCPEADIRVWKGSTSIDSAPALEGRACLTEIGGHTLAELMTTSGPRLFQHFLVRLDDSRIEVCTAASVSVWAIFWAGQGEQPSVFSLEDVEYTVSHRGETDDIFVISDASRLEASLTRNLPSLAKLCDSEWEDDEGPRWMVFERVTPPPADYSSGPDKPDGPAVRSD